MNKIRVSCAALCRIEIDGKLLLEVNKNRGNVLTPIGGALEFADEARAFLLSLGAEPQKGRDLRLSMPKERLKDFSAWFCKRENRETSPLLELREELQQEHALPLAVESLTRTKMVLIGCVEIEEKSSRTGMQGVTTHYFFETFHVSLDTESSDIIRSTLRNRTAPRLRLVTREEIAAGLNGEGLPIGTSAKTLFANDTTG